MIVKVLKLGEVEVVAIMGTLFVALGLHVLIASCSQFGIVVRLPK